MTTVAAIRTALGTRIDATSLSYYPTGRSQLTRARMIPWVEMGASEIDRTYVIRSIEMGTPLYFGHVDQIEYAGRMVIEVGHLKTGDENVMLPRLETDIHEIVKRIEDKAGYPSGVSLIRLQSQSQRDVTVTGSVFTATSLTFKIVYTYTL